MPLSFFRYPSDHLWYLSWLGLVEVFISLDFVGLPSVYRNSDAEGTTDDRPNRHLGSQHAAAAEHGDVFPHQEQLPP